MPRAKPRIPALGAVQVLSEETRNARTESPRHYPDNDLVVVRRVAAWISDAPPYGVATYGISEGKKVERPAHSVAVDGSTMHNAHLRVVVDESGGVSVDHLTSGRRISGAIAFVDETDVGDLYTPAPRPRESATEFQGLRRVHLGPLRGELEARYRIRDLSRRGRSDVELSLHLVLDADAPFLRVEIGGKNHATDHRLRIVFRSDVPHGDVWADAAFAPVRRQPLEIGQAEAAIEHAQPTAPLHRYVSLFNGSGGFTVFSDGLAEYEARESGELLVTLLRAVGELSKNDLPERPGHAGWPSPTPAAQCLGPFEASFAVMLHGPRAITTIDAIERTADDVLLPLVGTTLRSAIDPVKEVQGIELFGQGLAFSSIKQSEDGDWIVLRCVNRTDDPIAGIWRLPFTVREASEARLDETLIAPIQASDADLPFTAAPCAISTILVR
jgi:alpha-mannosidase